MEKLNFVKDGIVKLPPGFRFQPTDEEIVFQYLTRKIFSFPLPASIIPEINISQYNPWDLPGEWEEDRYFFNYKKEGNYKNESRSNRASGCGYWKATGLDKKIITSPRKKQDEIIMGMRKTFVFYKGKNGCRTNWMMHEYRLLRAQNAQSSWIEMGSWVLCHIFLNSTGENIDEAELMMRINNNLTSYGPISCSSSSSSCGSSNVVTEGICSSGLDDQETSSHI
ncbi:hypothetical protein LguiA_028400 [Lonicera macranthoides]